MSHGSPLSINYEQLEFYLTAGRWKEADQETNKFLEEIENKEAEEKKEYDRKFIATEDIKIVDKLWTEASNGHFAFSVQIEVYRNLGGQNVLGDTDKDVWKNFCKQLGWLNKKHYLASEPFTIKPDKLIFSLNAPRGHLPSFIKKTPNNQFGISTLTIQARVATIPFIDLYRGNSVWHLRHILERLQ